MMALLSKALSAINPPKAIPSISGATPTVSKRWPGSRTKRTRLPSASVSASNFVCHAALGFAVSPPARRRAYRFIGRSVARLIERYGV